MSRLSLHSISICTSFPETPPLKDGWTEKSLDRCIYLPASALMYLHSIRWRSVFKATVFPFILQCLLIKEVVLDVSAHQASHLFVASLQTPTEPFGSDFVTKRSHWINNISVVEAAVLSSLSSRWRSTLIIRVIIILSCCDMLVWRWGAESYDLFPEPVRVRAAVGCRRKMMMMIKGEVKSRLPWQSSRKWPGDHVGESIYVSSSLQRPFYAPRWDGCWWKVTDGECTDSRMIDAGMCSSVIITSNQERYGFARVSLLIS